jgi:hypothetical protein
MFLPEFAVQGFPMIVQAIKEVFVQLKEPLSFYYCLVFSSNNKIMLS